MDFTIDHRHSCWRCLWLARSGWSQPIGCRLRQIAFPHRFWFQSPPEELQFPRDFRGTNLIFIEFLQQINWSSTLASDAKELESLPPVRLRLPNLHGMPARFIRSAPPELNRSMPTWIQSTPGWKPDPTALNDPLSAILIVGKLTCIPPA